MEVGEAHGDEFRGWIDVGKEDPHMANGQRETLKSWKANSLKEFVYKFVMAGEMERCEGREGEGDSCALRYGLGFYP